MRRISLTCAAAILVFPAVIVCQEIPGREEIVRALLQRSRFLEDAAFAVPIEFYRQYLRDKAGEQTPGPSAPVEMIAEEGSYQLTVSKDRQVTLQASLRVRIFDPTKCRNLPVLTAALAWEKITVNGKEAQLATVDKHLRFTPDKEGEFLISAQVELRTADPDGKTISLTIPRTVRTLARFDSPLEWEVQAPGDDRRIVPLPGKGTAGQLALTPRDTLELTFRRPQPVAERPPRYELSGDVAWNIDAASQHVTAALTVAIAGGASDRIALVLPASADRVVVSGPDVQEFQAAGGEVKVFLRGRIRGRTPLNVSYEMPPVKVGPQDFGVLGVRDGHWTGGTLVVTNTAGGSEILPSTITGLKELALAEIPSSASGILGGPAVLAYEISARDWSASVEQVFLGEFALRESIADLAHYEVFFTDDGSVFCKVSYEIRNRNRQFLRLDLPPGSRVLLARVNEKAQPLSPVPGQDDAWLLPLVRSMPSVKGLVSFPVEVVFVSRGRALRDKGTAEVPLPAVDLPIAYAWCRAYVPSGMEVRQWSGPLKRVDSFSSETARASLDYGRGELAEGYTEKARPTVGAVEGAQRPAVRPETAHRVQAEKVPAGGGARFAPSSQPTSFDDDRISLARNYYRAGKGYYDRGDLAQASQLLERVQQLAPGSNEAANAERLLANTKMLTGKLELKSQSEKAAGLEVQREVSTLNRAMEEQQAQFVEQGLELARKGDVRQAKSKFQAAESLGKQIVAKGGQEKEVSAKLRSVKGEFEKVQKQEQTQARQVLEEARKLKAAGRYEEAFKVAGQLSGYKLELDADGDKELGNVKKELEDLAILANKEQQYNQRLQAAQAQVKKLREQVKALGGGTEEGKDGTRDDYTDLEEMPAQDAPHGRKEDRLGRLEYERDRLEKQLVQQQTKMVDFGSERARVGPGGAPKTTSGTLIERHGGAVARAPRNVTVFQLRNADAQEVRKVLTEVFARSESRGRGAGTATVDEGMQIVVDTSTNRLIVSAGSEDKLDKVKAFLTELDEPAGIDGDRRGVISRAREIPWEPVSKFPRDWRELTARGEPGGHAPARTMDEELRDMAAARADAASELQVARRKLGDTHATVRDIQARIDALDREIRAGGGGGGGGQAAGQGQGREQGQAWDRWLASEQAGGFTYRPAPEGQRRVDQRAWNQPEGPTSPIIQSRSGAQPSSPAGQSALAPGVTEKVYDIRDLLVRVPQFAGPRIDMTSVFQNAGKPSDLPSGMGKEGQPADVKRQIQEVIKETVDPDSWKGDNTVREYNGRLIVRQTADNQKMVENLIRQLRQARGPQVQAGEQLAEQEAKGITSNLALGGNAVVNAGRMPTAGDQRTGDGTLDVSGPNVRAEVSNDLRQFITSNYGWANLSGTNDFTWGTNLPAGRQGTGGPILTLTNGQSTTVLPAAQGVQMTGEELLQKLRFNRGQTVAVNSVNINGSAATAQSLGVTFTTGNNDVRYGLIDEAQFRTLMEIDDRSTRAGNAVVDNNDRTQDAIVGTDALLANGWTANVTFAGDRGNALDINDNAIAITHDRYVVIDNGSFLTVVRAGQMKHWTEKDTSLQAVEIPQSIEAPREGQLVKFEKSLVKPTDRLVLRADYTWKGASQ